MYEKSPLIKPTAYFESSRRDVRRILTCCCIILGRMGSFCYIPYSVIVAHFEFPVRMFVCACACVCMCV